MASEKTTGGDAGTRVPGTLRRFVLRAVYLSPDSDVVLRRIAFDTKRGIGEVIRDALDEWTREHDPIAAAPSTGAPDQ